MKKIFVIRHGNAYDENWRQLPDSPLNISGLKHAEALALRFKDASVDEVYSSTMERAVDTCREFLKYHPAITPVYEDSLREVVDEQFASDHEKLVYLVDKFEGVRREVYKSFQSIVESSKGPSVFLFTHGHFIRFLIMSVLRGDVYGFFNMSVDFASVSLIKVNDDGKYELVLFNDSSHTKGIDYGCWWC